MMERVAEFFAARTLDFVASFQEAKNLFAVSRSEGEPMGEAPGAAGGASPRVA